MIKTGGANVSPVEVEARAVEVGTLALVAVVGVPHPTLGEAVVMWAVPLDGVAADVPAVLSHLRETLASYKIPKRVVLCREEDLSFTASDKVRLDRVRRLAAERIVATDDDLPWVEYLKGRTDVDPGP
jgi:acyl-CoA synthetase (AMP-forming)/AMP-acid ligase II